MTKQQQVKLASRLVTYAPAILDVTWSRGNIDSIVVDRNRIDMAFLGSLRQLGFENGFTVLQGV